MATSDVCKCFPMEQFSRLKNAAREKVMPCMEITARKRTVGTKDTLYAVPCSSNCTGNTFNNFDAWCIQCMMHVSHLITLMHPCRVIYNQGNHPG